MTKKPKLLAVLSLLAIIAAVAGLHASQSSTQIVRGPPDPPWVKDDGTVDQAKLDAAVVDVAGPDGAPLVCDGRLVRIRVRELTGPPPAPLVPRARPGAGIIRPTVVTALHARCGPHGQLRWST